MVRRGRLAPVNRESTPSIVATTLRGAIIDGTLPPGAQLAEADLAAELGVSRGPLREAMQRLVQEGFLRGERHRGLFVVRLTPDDVRDIYVAREAVERAAAALMLRDDHRRAGERLEAAYEVLVEAARQGDADAAADADLGFHLALVEESGSARLLRAARTLFGETRMWLGGIPDAYRTPGEIVEAHGAIATAVTNGDETRALALVDAHMRAASRRLACAPPLRGTWPTTPVR